ncbi:hypothetical protein BU14_0502s0005 [Porphyra umbilicalis]|uniref:Uncharacterized protein n=1 Tax=Porphyra umbilicalis TaxID=2786 RepID=A0A1X6NT34_PORUM|nr:hypothetical protein BU14_0502s0005 [Porphyra umbilicalis]|eukprot:OSX71772.1 hypothetical protein BU14_0502s0005 [Porphyra umbilicalis]
MGIARSRRRRQAGWCTRGPPVEDAAKHEDVGLPLGRHRRRRRAADMDAPLKRPPPRRHRHRPRRLLQRVGVIVEGHLHPHFRALRRARQLVERVDLDDAPKVETVPLAHPPHRRVLVADGAAAAAAEGAPHQRLGGRHRGPKRPTTRYVTAAAASASAGDTRAAAPSAAGAGAGAAAGSTSSASAAAAAAAVAAVAAAADVAGTAAAGAVTATAPPMAPAVAAESGVGPWAATAGSTAAAAAAASGRSATSASTARRRRGGHKDRRHGRGAARRRRRAGAVAGVGRTAQWLPPNGRRSARGMTPATLAAVRGGRGRRHRPRGGAATAAYPPPQPFGGVVAATIAAASFAALVVQGGGERACRHQGVLRAAETEILLTIETFGSHMGLGASPILKMGPLNSNPPLASDNNRRLWRFVGAHTGLATIDCAAPTRSRSMQVSTGGGGRVLDATAGGGSPSDWQQSTVRHQVAAVRCRFQPGRGAAATDAESRMQTTMMICARPPGYGVSEFSGDVDTGLSRVAVNGSPTLFNEGKGFNERPTSPKNA